MSAVAYFLLLLYTRRDTNCVFPFCFQIETALFSFFFFSDAGSCQHWEPPLKVKIIEFPTTAAVVTRKLPCLLPYLVHKSWWMPVSSFSSSRRRRVSAVLLCVLQQLVEEKKKNQAKNRIKIKYNFVCVCILRCLFPSTSSSYFLFCCFSFYGMTTRRSLAHYRLLVFLMSRKATAVRRPITYIGRFRVFGKTVLGVFFFSRNRHLHYMTVWWWLFEKKEDTNNNKFAQSS